jgi:hypothetical protein
LLSEPFMGAADNDPDPLLPASITSTSRRLLAIGDQDAVNDDCIITGRPCDGLGGDISDIIFNEDVARGGREGAAFTVAFEQPATRGEGATFWNSVT